MISGQKVINIVLVLLGLTTSFALLSTIIDNRKSDEQKKPEPEINTKIQPPLKEKGVNKNTSTSVQIPELSKSLDPKEIKKLVTQIASPPDYVLTLEKSRQEGNQSIKRSRILTIDLSNLTIGKETLIDLFDDISLKVVFESRRNDSVQTTKEIWQGKVQGEENSTVVLVVAEKSGVTGAIRIHGKCLYEIDYLCENFHSIRELDETNLKELPFPLKPNDLK